MKGIEIRNKQGIAYYTNTAAETRVLLFCVKEKYLLFLILQPDVIAQGWPEATLLKVLIAPKSFENLEKMHERAEKILKKFIHLQKLKPSPASAE